MSLPEAWLPWLAVAGLGILHGLNPANGWLFVAARATEHRDGRAGRRSLLPLASGHAVSVLLVVIVVMQGAIPDGKRFQLVGGLLLLALAAWRILRRHARHPCPGPVHMRHPATGLALWSCLMGTAHGSGLMLVPALIPLCVSAGPARAITASGSLMLMLAAVILHLLAMLSTTHLIASGVCRLRTHRMTRYARHLPWLWTLLLALTGAAMIAMR
jgi:hypothetical protein